MQLKINPKIYTVSTSIAHNDYISKKKKFNYFLFLVQELKKQKSLNVSEEEAALRIQKGLIISIS